MGLIILVCLTKRPVFHALTRPPFIALYIIVITSSIAMIIGETVKPFWPYHLLRLPIYFGGIYSITLLTKSGEMHLSLWCSVFLLTVILSTVLDAFFPQYFPDFFVNNRVESFWGSERNVYTEEFAIRKMGIYANYQELSTVAFIGFLICLGYLFKTGWSLRFVALISLMAGTLFCIFLSGSRTAVIAITIGASVIIFMELNIIKGLSQRTLSSLGKFILLAILLTSGIVFLQSDYIATLFPALEIASRFAFLEHVVKLLQGTIDSSFGKTLETIYFPDKVITLFIGNGGQPHFPGGVYSDIGYIQLLWGTGLVGLITIIAFYLFMFFQMMHLKTVFNHPMIGSITALIVVTFIINIKGQWFIGIHAGDLVVAGYGFLLGAYHRRLYLEKTQQKENR